MIVRVKDLKARAIIGIHDWEKEKERDLILNVEMEFDGSKAAETDQIENTLDYDTISQKLIAETANTRFDLIEKLASHLLDIIMEDTRITRARIEVDKPGAITTAKSVSVVEERGH